MNKSFCSEILLLALIFKVYRLLKYQSDFFSCKKRLAFMGLVNTNCLLAGLPSTSKKTGNDRKITQCPFQNSNLYRQHQSSPRFDTKAMRQEQLNLSPE